MNRPRILQSSLTLPRGRHRRGTVCVIALLILGVMSALLIQHTRRVLADRRQNRQLAVREQAEQLARAGLLIARRASQADSEWTGTTWQLPPGRIHQTNSAEVTIEVHDGQCTVVARYPANSDFPVQVTRTRKLTP